MRKIKRSSIKSHSFCQTDASGLAFTRLLLIVSLILTLFMYTWMSYTYKEMVRAYRISTPSNIKQEVDVRTFCGHVSSIDREKEILIFKSDALNSKIMIYLNQMDKEEKTKLYKALESGENTFEIKIDVNERQFRDTHNFYDFDYQKYLFSKNIIGQYHLRAYKLSELNQNGFLPFLARMKINSIDYTQKYMPDKIMMYFNALVLGESNFLSEKDLYRTLGISHVFAISGMHFGLLYLFLNTIIKLPRRIKSCLILMLLFGYWGLVGFTYSAGRAVLLVLYIEVARSLLRKVDVLSGIAFTNLVLLLVFPKSILSVSYQLSFIAYLLIAYFYQKFNLNVCKYKSLKALHFALYIQIVFLPIQLYYFGEANVFSFISNIILVPMISILFPLLFMVPFLGNVINRLLECFILLIESLAGKMPIRLIHVQVFTVDQFRILMIMTLVYFALKSTNLKLGKRSFIGLITLTSLIFITCGFSPELSEIHFMDVGHGDSTLIIEGQYKILIDTGDTYSPIVEILNKKGINRLNAVFLTHAHEDHIGGLSALLKVIKVDQIYCNQETLDKIKGLIPNETDVIMVASIIQVYLGEATLKLMPTRSSETNDNAIAIEYRAATVNGIFLGDISGPNYEKLPFESQEITFLKVSHHGSKTGFSQKFLDEHKVKYAIISHNEKYLMPNKDVLDLLNTYKVIVLETYRLGGIEMSPQGVRSYFDKELN